MGAPFRLTARSHKEGGGLAPISATYGDPIGFRTITIWIHGFNNTEYLMGSLWDLDL